jgi:hypothetical protein
MSWITLYLLALFVPALKAQDGLLGALAQKTDLAHRLNFNQQLAAADFDNDQKPDGAVLLPGGLLDGERLFRIELHVTSGTNGVILFSAAEQNLSISALDVNHDGSPDIVIAKTTGERLQVYLNDGHGAFHKARSELDTYRDPFAPLLHAWFTQGLPSSCLPAARNFDPVSLNGASSFAPDQTRFFNAVSEELLLDAGQQSPSRSRAPPSFHSI